MSADSPLTRKPDSAELAEIQRDRKTPTGVAPEGGGFPVLADQTVTESINLEDLLGAARRVVNEWDTDDQDGYTISWQMNDALEALAEAVGHTMRVDR